jgi:hypothetical protein
MSSPQNVDGKLHKQEILKLEFRNAYHELID